MSTVLETIQVPIDSVRPHPRNPRKGDVEVIKESLAEHGQYRAIVVNKETNEILAGNHTWRAAKEIGWDSILAHYVTVTEEAAQKLLLVDNRASDLAVYDQGVHAALLEELQLKGQLKGTGYDPEQVDTLLSEYDALPELDEEFQGGYAESAEETAGRYREPGEVIPQRQFILMVPESEAADIEEQIRALRKAWGISEFRGIVREALRQCVASL